MSDAGANPYRGEAVIEIAGQHLRLRPSFTALVAAEQELGPLFALVERAGEGRLTLAEMVALFWHCLADQGAMSREDFAESVAALGLAPSAKPLRALLGQILQGTA